MNEIFLLGNEYSRKKTKEELEREWQEFEKEQEKAFAELLISKGIKPQNPIQPNPVTSVMSQIA